MARKLVLSIVVVAGVVCGVGTGAVGKGHHRVSVKPLVGSRSTRFVVTFRTAQAAGRSGSVDRSYIVQATISGRSRGCVSTVSKTVSKAPAHARVRVTLDPHGKWCVGTFRGDIAEVEKPHCPGGPGGVACPLSIAQGTFGKFSFRVKRVARDTTPPTFAGLERAFACTPGPQQPGQTTPYTLSWHAATDNVTPSEEIVYDVFMSTTSGGENFGKPNWTTPPGATTFRTPGLPSNETVYFVARARDEAGNEDRNKVERPGVDPCV
jgi:hypothetical protein